MKRNRAPRAKPGELKAQWGKLPHDSPDLIYARGEGVSKRDASLLHYMISGKRLVLTMGKEKERTRWKFGKSFIEELEDRGYDITTFRFSVQMKRPSTD